MASKDKPLTALQLEAIRTAEPTLFGDFAVVMPRALPSLRARGLCAGRWPHVYLTEAGKQLRA